MQLSTYIADLLYRYECVIIPGFGAFLTRYQSARIDGETHTFHPPSKTISFNRQLQANDGLFANYVASVEKCSYETALQKIRNFSSRITKELQEGKTVTFKGIGRFSVNGEAAIQFEPINQENFSTSAFGLGSFVAPAIARTGQTVDKKTETPVIPIGKNSRPYLKYAAVAVVALLAGGFGGLKLYEHQVQEYNLAERQKANSLVENQIQEATFVIDNPLPVLNLRLSKHSGNYHIVAGAFRLEENADKKVEQLREKGYSPLKLGASRYGLHQVLYASFESRTEALRKLYEIQHSENPDAWLLVQELDLDETP